MNVGGPSLHQSALDVMHSGFNGLEENALEISKLGLGGNKQHQAPAETVRSAPSVNPPDNADFIKDQLESDFDIEEALIDNMIHVLEVKSGALVLTTENEAIGSILDIQA